MSIPRIRKLPSHLINQIAAGEVVERPASVIKELVENSLDAGATKIQIHLTQAGTARIQIIDNGEGMQPDDMVRAIERHATSKLPDENLFAIHTMGFRGEALPAIGAISRLQLTSRFHENDQGWTLSVMGGEITPPKPDAWSQGTKVDVRDLFYAIPARLKFLKALKTELTHCTDVVQHIAMGHPEVSFILTHDERTLFDRPTESYLDRAVAIMGPSFRSSALPIRAAHDGMTLTGFLGLPTDNKSTQKLQYIYINGRWIKDRSLQAMLKGAYGDLIPRDRFPVFVLYITMPPAAVDVNVHPAKTEVRFQDPVALRKFLTASCRQILSTESHRSHVTVSLPEPRTTLTDKQTVNPVTAHPVMTPTPLPLKTPRPAAGPEYYRTFSASQTAETAPVLRAPPAFLSSRSGDLSMPVTTQAPLPDQTPDLPPDLPPDLTGPISNQASYQALHQAGDASLPLGYSKAQIFNTYILCETRDSLIIVDQHAAHERLVYEKMKTAVKNGKVPRQMLLIPESVDISPHTTDQLAHWLPILEKLGLCLAIEDDHHLSIKEVPSIMKDFDFKTLVQHVATEITELGQATALETHMDRLLATFSCHGSIRAGRRLTLPECDAMLRQIEEQAFTAQCIHGRPSYVTLSRKDLENFFERS